MQGRLFLLEVRHGSIEGLRILLDELLNQLQVSDADRREDMVAGAALEEERHHAARIFVRWAEEGCPADDVELMDVAKAVDIASGIEQRAHGFDVSVGGSPMQRVGVVSGFACVRIRAMRKQQAYGIHVPTPGGGVQSCAAKPIGFL